MPGFLLPLRGEVIPHRHHAALAEAVLLVEFARTALLLVGEERDAKESFSRA